MKRIDFIENLLFLTSEFDGDGNGMCCDYEEAVNILKQKYPELFEIYNMLEE